MGIHVKEFPIDNSFNKMLHKRQILVNVLYKTYYISYQTLRILCQNK